MVIGTLGLASGAKIKENGGQRGQSAKKRQNGEPSSVAMARAKWTSTTLLLWGNCRLMSIGTTLLHRWIPELRHFEHEDQRRRAFRKARNEVFRSPLYWVFVVLVTTAAIFVRLSASRPASFPRLLGAILWGVGLGFFGSISALWMLKGRIRLSVRRELTQSGRPVCMSCGHYFMESDNGKCPECGRVFQDSDV